MTVLAVGLALTSLWAVSARATTMRTAHDVMDRRALFVSEAVRVSADTVIRATSAAAGLFTSSDHVRQDEFERFIRTAGQHSGTVATAYIPHLSLSDWPSFIEEATRTQPGFSMFKFDHLGSPTPVNGQPTRWPVQYAVAASPFEPDLRGFDAASDPVWVELLTRTGQTQHPSISALTQLFGIPGEWGFIAASPVLENRTVTGYTVEIARLSGLVEAELADSLSQVVWWQVTDLTGEGAPPTESPDPLRRSVTLELGGRLWEVEVIPTDSARTDLVGTGLPSQLVPGLLLTLVAAVASHLAMNTTRARREAHRLRWIAEEKDDFLTALSHELRTPLTVVVGMADILEETTVSADAEVREYVSLVRQEGHALARLVDDLLLLGRLDAEVLPIRPEILDVRWEAERIVSELTQPDGVRVSLQGSGSAWADPLRLRHIIRHLYSNALRHGGEDIALTLTSQRRQTVLRVTDNGIGVPAEKVGGLFTSARGSKETPGGPASLGLGLRVSQRLASALGGQLTYRRENDITIFELRLPAVPPRDGEGSDSNASREDASDQTRRQ
ncbi:MAG: ATP-binding protein [Acidimicrobiia bacterium]